VPLRDERGAGVAQLLKCVHAAVLQATRQVGCLL
jgi:hypothetical protein